MPSQQYGVEVQTLPRRKDREHNYKNTLCNFEVIKFLLYYSSQFLYWILQDVELHIQDNTQKDQFFCGAMEMTRQRHSLFDIMLDILECFLMQVRSLDGGGREDLL